MREPRARAGVARILILGALMTSTIWAQGTPNSNAIQGQLRALNAQILSTQGLFRAAAASAKSGLHSQASTILARRQQLLSSLIASDAEAALNLALPADVLKSLAKDFPGTALEDRGTFTGEYEFLVEDGVDPKDNRDRRLLKGPKGTLELFPGASGVLDEATCSGMIVASGVQSGGNVAVSSTQFSAAVSTCSKTGAQNVVVIVANMPSQAVTGALTDDVIRGGFLGNAYTTAVQTPDRSLSDFWMQASDGKTWVDPTSFTVVRVTIPDNLTYCSSSYSTSLSAAYKAADPYVNYNNFSRIAVIFPNIEPSCGYAGVATTSCATSPGDGASGLTWTWFRDDQAASRNQIVQLAGHEMGHNLSLIHSGSRDHGTEVVGNVGVAGTRSEYGDRFSTQGFWNYGLYNAQHNWERLGWRTPANIMDVSSSGTYSIEDYQKRPAGIKALKVRRDTSTGTGYFFVSFYPSTGMYLSALSADIHNGAYITYNDSATPSGATDLLDFSPDTASFLDPELPFGQSWSDPYGNLTITIGNPVGAVGDQTLPVTINYGSVPCTSAAPSVTFTGTTSQSVLAGGSANFSLRVANNDSSNCSARTFNLSSALPSGSNWNSSFAQNSITLAPGAQGTVTLTKTAVSPAVGTYTVDGTASSGSDVVTASNAAVTVVASVSDLGISLTAPSSAVVNTSFNVTVKVTNMGNQPMPAGNVTTNFGAGSYAYGSLAVGASANVVIPDSVASAGDVMLSATLPTDASASNNVASQVVSITAPPSNPPTAPSNVNVNETTIGKGKKKTVVGAVLSWVDNSSDENNFQISACTTSGRGRSKTTTCATPVSVPANTTQLALDPNAVASGYKVRAVNGNGTSAWATWGTTN